MDTLFFVSAKFFWIVVRPESWILFLLLATVWALHRNRVRAGKKLLLATISVILVIGFLPIGNALLRPLEVRFPPTPNIVSPAGIIVLGGG